MPRRKVIGPGAGSIAGIGVLLICIIVLSVLALIVVKALVGSPWGTFTVFCTIPIALLMGIYSRFIRPGRIAEMSAIGVVLLLLAPRDYLSTFMKVGTVIMLAIGIMVVRPDLQMAAVTKFIDGSGPVWADSVFPFLFITIACGAVSGWHALISSGTTPKMIENEQQIRFIGYGAMLMESFAAIMAMIAATVINPGVYFAMNSAGGVIGGDVVHAAQVISGWGFVVTPDMLNQVARDVGETTILSRTGGAPTLAVGMASILSGLVGGKALMGLWYHSCR